MKKNLKAVTSKKVIYTASKEAVKFDDVLESIELNKFENGLCVTMQGKVKLRNGGYADGMKYYNFNLNQLHSLIIHFDQIKKFYDTQAVQLKEVQNLAIQQRIDAKATKTQLIKEQPKQTVKKFVEVNGVRYYQA